MRDFKAQYRPTGAPELRAIRVEGLMPTFISLAQTFGVNIIVDCPDKPLNLSEPPDLGKTREVFFHLDTHPSRYTMVATFKASSLFYLTSSTPISIEIANLEKGISPYSLPRTNLTSPEGTIVGCVLGSHIFIYPNVLTNDIWTEEERRTILNLIAYWFMPQAIINTLPNHRNHIESGLNSLRSNYRNLHLINPERREEAKKTFAAFIAKINAQRTVKIEARIAEIQKAIENTSKNYFEAMLQNIQNKEQLEAIRSELLGKDFGKEFESLLVMEPVETVRVQDDRYILIKTSPILQIPAVDRETGISQSYDIGEYIIAMDTVWPEFSLPSLSSIRFRQGKYRGQFEHAHIKNMSDTCFGNSSQLDNMGLNPAITSLVSRFEIVPLIHLLITFMKKERTRPSERADWDDSIEPTMDYYANSEEKRLAKESFIALMSKTVSKLSVDQLEKKIKELDREIASLHQAMVLAKADLDDQEAIWDRIDYFVFDTAEIKREANFIFDELSIFWADLNPECIVICFCQRRMNSLDQSYTPEDFILKLRTDYFPELLVQTPKKCFQSIPLINPNKLKSGELKGDDEIIIKNLSTGKISEVLAMVKSKISDGFFDKKNKNQEAKNGE